MEELTESARQYLVSQGIVYGSLSAFASLILLLTGIAVIFRANDILQFTSLIHVAILHIVCGTFSILLISFVCWFVAGYRHRQIEIRSKYLDDNMTKGLIAMFLPLFLNYSALIVCLVFLLIKNETVIQYEMKNSIAMYSTDDKIKVLVDKLQIILRCCGSQSLADWFMADWQGTSEKNETLTTSLVYYTDWDAVPFSCCKLESQPPCIHQQLQVFGISSLYSNGCAKKISKAIAIFVASSFVVFLVASITMTCVLYSSRKLQTSARAAVEKGDATAPSTWWLFRSKRANYSDYTTSVQPEEESLLGHHDHHVRRSSSDFAFHERKCVCPVIVLRKSKIIDSRLDLDRNYDNFQTEIESSEDWPSRLTDDVYASTSASSFQTVSLPYELPADSRRSVSDTAVANLEVSHHYEHKIRPLYRS